MSFFARSSIKRKLTLIMMISCGAALLVACVAILYIEVAGAKTSLLRSTRVMADVLAANCAAPLGFDYKNEVKETLSALKAEPHIISASVYNRKGEVFAVYYREGVQHAAPPAPARNDQFIFTNDTLDLFHQIVVDGETAGTLFIQSDLGMIKDRFRAYLEITLVVMISAAFLSFLLSLRLQRLISRPISELAHVANRVARENNYSIRADKRSTDEMGQLIDRFNDMLCGIQERDAALLEAQEVLEQRVQERTAELQSEITERVRVESELRLSQQKFETLVHSIEAVVWEADPETFAFTFVSQQAARILGYPLWEWTRDPGFWKTHVWEKDLLLAQELRVKALEREKPIQIEYRMGAKDGRTVWIREISTCAFENGKAIALRGVLFDITEQKQAEEELDRLNRRLVESSRRAGMAEIATGVLHNVGNVLNSVNVSSTLISDHVRNSRSTRLRGVVGLLNDNASRLADFLTNDPKGKVIPGYLAHLAERLGIEQQEVLKELELLTKNIEHIKEIVAMQQTYARVSGVIEVLPVKNLVEDALQMNAAALTRHGVVVVRNFADVPPTALDKHKVLQILVNLIRNAKYAIDAAARSDKRMNVEIRQNERGMIEIVIADNGIGIPPENLTKIFSHGFTTKKDGHGFGLHSGALAAREMGGTLQAFSEGEGKGATFILELPLTKSPEHTHKTDRGASL